MLVRVQPSHFSYFERNTMTLAQKILTILDNATYCLNIEKAVNGFLIYYGGLHHAPDLTFRQLAKLSALFGTQEIYISAGDDTHVITIYKATKNCMELEKLIGKDLTYQVY